MGEHFVTSLARPGGNITGLSATVSEMAGKRVELLRTLAPDVSRIAYIGQASTVRQAVVGTEAAARTLGLQITTLLIRSRSEFDQALSSVTTARPGALVVDLTVREHWKQILDVASRNRLPTVSGPREFVDAGGLMAYGPHFPDLFRRAATYVDRILKGGRPADLPIEQPTKFEFVINGKTAKTLGLTVPPSLLVQADQIVD